VACTGVHGANRLASNSLLEAVVFGRRLGYALSHAPSEAKQFGEFMIGEPNETLSLDVDDILWMRLRELMWTHAGIVREESGLKFALAQLAEIEKQVPAGQILLINRVRLAAGIVSAALARKVSRGAHFREDYPPAVATDLDQEVRACTGT
jgi:L-aspartate oxidase